MGITSDRLKELGLVDEIIKEPLGGAHRDHVEMVGNIKTALVSELNILSEISSEEIISLRKDKIRKYGNFKET
jgi:acetyl-CoA carboxylase carboxyl transferase subunit alpha